MRVCTYEFAHPGHRATSLTEIRWHENLVKHVVTSVLDQVHDGHPGGLVVVISEDLFV